MALFPQQFIDDLRLQANIMQVVQEYVPLKKAGRRKGLLPVSLEKTPSFTVNPEKASSIASGAQCRRRRLQVPRASREGVSRRRPVARSEGWPHDSRGRLDGASEEGGRTPLREALLKVHEVAAAYSASSWPATPARARENSWPIGTSPRRRLNVSASASRPHRATGSKPCWSSRGLRSHFSFKAG